MRDVQWMLPPHTLESHCVFSKSRFSICCIPGGDLLERQSSWQVHPEKWSCHEWDPWLSILKWPSGSCHVSDNEWEALSCELQAKAASVSQGYNCLCGASERPFLCYLWKLTRLSSAFTFTHRSIHTHLMMNTYQWHTKCLSKAQAALKYHTLKDLNSTPLFSHVFIFFLI